MATTSLSARWSDEAGSTGVTPGKLDETRLWDDGMMEPDVAIIVRTKDRTSMLRRALTSITEQRDARWECVVVNDGGSAHDVDAVIDALPPASRSRITVVHSAESRGRWKSANAGVLASTAPLIVIHDDDDTWHPTFLHRAVDYLADHPERDGIVARTEIVWESRDTDDRLTPTAREIFQPQLQDLLLSDALLFNRYVPIGFVYRRKLHEELGLYDDSLPVIGDWDFNLKVLQRGPLEYLSTEPLAFWHQRANDAGSDGNSVISASGDHARFDALLRDKALRAYTEKNGQGLVLYLTKFIDRRLVDIETAIVREVREASTVSKLKRRTRRFFPRR